MFVFVKYALYISKKLEFMRKEEVYLDLTKLTKEQLINVAKSVKDEMFSRSYEGLIKGSRGRYEYLQEVCNLWTRSSDKGSRKEITYDEFLINFGKMTETEKKLYDYAVSVDWDTDKMECRINEGGYFTWCEYESLKGCGPAEKITYFIEKYNPKVKSITIPKVDHGYKDVDVSMFEVKPAKEIKLSDYLPNPAMVTLPIEDYNRLRKLEIKQEIKRLRKELKSL